VRILALAQPKRQYYYQSTLGNRLFELGLGPLAQCFLAVSAKEEQKLLQQMLHTHGKEGFNQAWLKHKGLPWAAELLEPFVKEKKKTKRSKLEESCTR
jgi:type IV secretion system protein VirB4